MINIEIKYHKSGKFWLKLFICFNILTFINISLKAEIPRVFQVDYIKYNDHDVNNIDQIVLQFNKPIAVPDYSKQIFNLPIKIDPHIDCKWNVINSKTIACPINLQGTNKLKLATIYTIIVDNTLKAIDGTMLEQEKKFTFSTLHPDVAEISIYSWKNYGKPIFQLNFNQFIEANVLENVLYIIPDNPKLKDKKYKIRILSEEEFLSEDALNNLNKEFQNFFANENNKSLKNTKKIILFEPIDDLPAGEKFKVILGEGLKSAHGTEKNIGSKELLSFNSFNRSKFLGISCYSYNSGKYEEIKILTNTRDVEKKCLPEENINFIFSAPITFDSFKKYLKFNPQVDINFTQNNLSRVTKLDQMKLFNYNINSDGNYQISVSNIFPANQKINLQPNLKENHTLYERIKKWFTFQWREQKRILDVFGGILDQNFDFSFTTDHYKPQFFFPSSKDMIVLERSTKDDLEISERNFENIKLNCNILSSNLNSTNQIFNKNIDLSSQDSFLQIPLGLREILSGGTGLIVGKLLAYPIDLRYPVLKSTFITQVTNFNIIAKIGRYNSLIFVTDLTNGNVIKNAKVSLYRSKFLTFNTDKLQPATTGITDEYGIAILPGVKSFSENLKNQNNNDNDFIIQVEKGDDMGWLSLDYKDSIPLNSFQDIQSKSYYFKSDLLTWGFTDRGIYRPNDLVMYKLFVRNNKDSKLINAKDLNYKLSVLSKLGKIIYEQDNLRFSEFGSINGYFRLKEDIEPGYYDIILTSILESNEKVHKNDLILYSTKFFVENSKIAQFDIQTKINKEKLLNGEEARTKTFVKQNSNIQYLDAKLNLNVDLEPKIFIPDLKLEGFSFHSSEEFEKFENIRIFTREGKFDEKGEIIQKFKIEDSIMPFGILNISTTTYDQNKEIILANKRIRYFGVDRFVGIKLSDWPIEKDKKSIFSFIVVDIEGKLINDIEVKLEIEKKELNISQTQDLSMVNLPSWKFLDSCVKKSLSTENNCDFIFNEAGDYKVTATALDSKGRIHKIIQNFVVIDNLKEINPIERMNEELEIFIEKEKYNVGEKVRFMIKNSLIGANALITFERGGILKQFIKKFNKPFEIIEVDLDEKDAPGFYLSIALARQRIPNNQDKSILNADYIYSLYKPTTKIGYAKVLVQNPKNNLKVNISTDKENYKLKDDVQLSLKLSNDNKIHEVEASILIVDDAMIDLLPDKIDYFNPNMGFSVVHDLDVKNYSLFKANLTSIKTVPMNNIDRNNNNLYFGSNFGASAFEDNFILHKDEVKNISFKLPDSLKNWRVIVITNDKNNLFGMDNRLLEVDQSDDKIS